MIAISRLIVSGVSAGKPRIYPAIVRMPCFFQASSIFRYSVILFWRFFAAARLSGVDVLKSDEHLVDTGSLCLFHEVGNFVTRRIDLDHEAERDAFIFTKLNQAVKGRFPLL